MVKKETIGKIQLWLGITLFIISVIGIIFSINKINEPLAINDDSERPSTFIFNYIESQNFTQEEITKINPVLGLYLVEEGMDNLAKWRTILLGGIISIILSIIISLQGLANISKESKR